MAVSFTCKLAAVGQDLGLVVHRPSSSSQWLATSLVANGLCDPGEFCIEVPDLAGQFGDLLSVQFQTSRTTNVILFT